MPHALTVISPDVVRDRSTYIGGSDAAAVLGESRWTTPLQVFLEKTGQAPPKDLDKEFRIRWGKSCEDDVADEFTYQTKKKLHRVKQTIIHPKYPFIAANIDRRVVGEQAGFEAKTASAYKYKDWQGEEIPIDYIFQCYHYLMVTGWPTWYITCAIGNQECPTKVIPRNEKFQNYLLEKEVEFWTKYVIPREVPNIVTKNDAGTLLHMFPNAVELKETMLGDDGDKAMEYLEGLKADLKHLKGTIAEIENQIKFMMKDAEIGYGLNYEARWHNVSTSRFDVTKFKAEKPELYAEYSQPESTRRFICKKRKEEM